MAHLLIAVIYLAFISLGLPDSLLGSAWPTMTGELSVPLSYAGYISMTISAGTILSSLMSDRLTRRFDTGIVTCASVLLTAAALFGFSVSDRYIFLILWSVPYGLGAGSIDAALNNYVALNYKSSHMSWLHCMWGVGTVVGPYVMGYALTSGMTWGMGYRIISMLQLALGVLMLFSLPLWKARREGTDPAVKGGTSPTLKKLLKLDGVPNVLLTFFCYCSLEIVAIVWSGTYLVYKGGFTPESAASLSSMFFIGITAGRAVGGFLTYKLSDRVMIRIGEGLTALGVLWLLILPEGYFALVGLVLIGLGCAPIYPAVIHSTPEYFGAENSGALIGIQMACAYTGMCLMPPVFGWVAQVTSPAVFPVVIGAFLAVMAVLHEALVSKKRIA
ncbi:MAG: MFS transporter [Clostridia bacterium]|nr:MFS transporter [Clostridia bacterium]